jgi:hypothetical protein
MTSFRASCECAPHRVPRVAVDGDAVSQGEMDAHRDGCTVAKRVTGAGPQVGAVEVRKRASPGRLPDAQP